MRKRDLIRPGRRVAHQIFYRDVSTAWNHLGAEYGWAWIGGFVIVWDLSQDDQLSHAFRRAPKPVTIATCAIVLGHLYEVIPKRYDIIHIVLSRH